ncbi:hypothetical protein L2E82_12799 [Cichorium intybus]|uniref:Uncharacterized protein n=1 Tax=Cichorium intybus TaxID=13427 RepID=A0ACB9GGT8_CICIN|nr:hypothetical protein L2E82_12799 [Cichorium intybus]
MEIALKIANKIRANERFAAYIVIPMWPEGSPTSTTVQRILFWQNKTMQMMYEVIYKALQEVGLHNVYEPQDYLNFFCLGTHESSHGVEPTFEENGSNSANSPQVIFFFLSFELVWDCSFELEVPDPETMVTFPVVGDVSWTTTPWTLLSNLALCVDSNFVYVKGAVDDNSAPKAKGSRGKAKNIVVAYEVLDKFPGSSLVGKKYVPLFEPRKEIYSKRYSSVNISFLVFSDPAIVVCMVQRGRTVY